MMAYVTSQQFGPYLQECDGIVADLDGTLVKGRVAEGMGKKFLKSELRRLHLRHAWSGLRNYKKVLKTGRGGEPYKGRSGQAAGLELFTDIMAGTGCATRGMMKAYARERIKESVLPGAREFIWHLKGTGKPVVCVTAGCSSAAEEAKEFFGFDSAWGNPMRYSEEGMLLGCDIVFDERTKLSETEDRLHRFYGLSINRCLVIGNDDLDVPLMLMSRLSASGPLATPQARDRAEVRIDDYVTFLRDIRGTD